MGNNDGTRTTKVGGVYIDLAEAHKRVTGVSITRFIEDAILQRVESLPPEVKKKMGIKTKSINRNSLK